MLHAVAPEVALQWQRNQTYPQGTIGRLMEPAYAVFHPAMTVAQTVERLRDLIKTAFITYGYVIDESSTPASASSPCATCCSPRTTQRLEALMLRDVFTLKPETQLERSDEARARPPLPGLPGVRRRTAC